MKILKQFIFPIAIVLIGTGAAFATNMAKQSESMLEPGYRFDPSAPVVKCIVTPVNCEPMGAAICTWTDANNVEHNLHRYVNDTTCGITLRKPM